MPASFPRREAQLTLRLFPCFWVGNIGGCQVESDNTGEKLWASDTATASSQQTPRPSLSLCYYPLLQELGIAVSQWLMTFPQLQRCHQHHCTQRSCWSVSLLLFLGFARLLCVFCFAVVRWRTVFYGSAWGELVHCGIISHALFDHTFLDGYLCCLHLLKIFTRKATWVSVSPGAHL